MTSQLPPAPDGDDSGNTPSHPGDSAGSRGGVPRNGVPTAAMALGIFSIVGTLLFVPLVGAVCSVLAIVLGIIGVRQVRAGRSNRRGFALTGLITGIAGLVLLIVVVAYAIRRFDACQQHIGHPPNSQELQQCREDRI